LIFNNSRRVSRLSRNNGGIHCEGILEGFQPVVFAGHEIEKALDGADIIYAVGPAYSTRPFAEACRPHLKKGQIVIVCPSSCGGAIEFKNGAGLDLRDEGIVVAETSTLPYAVRLLEPGKIRIFNKLKGGLLLAAVPAQKTGLCAGAGARCLSDDERGKEYTPDQLTKRQPGHPSGDYAHECRLNRTHQG
jgi:hypothetical protein